MGQIKNIKLHIVTDIKCFISATTTHNMLGKLFPRQAKTLVSTCSKSLRCVAAARPSVKLLCNNNSNQTSLMYTQNSSEVGSLIGTVRTFSSTARMLDYYEDGDEPMSVEDERAMNIQAQEQHAARLTMDGLPQHIEDHELEDEVLKLFNAMNARVDYRQLEAVFRVGNRVMVIVKFFDPMMVRVVWSKTSSIRDLDLYGGARIFIKQSLCREFTTINYFLRIAKREGRIYRYRLWSGTNQVMINEEDDFVEITHRNDLIELGIVDQFED